MKLTIEFVNVPMGTTQQVPGTFAWLQQTYDVLRAARNTEDSEPEEIASAEPDGRWRYEGAIYTDFIIAPAKEDV